ncbi:MAG: cell division-related protein [Frankiales bacterium]|nr:cell division-related protein [Frankiales bacterium]
MRTTLTVFCSAAPRPLDAVIELDPGDRVSALEVALTELLPTGSAGLWLGSVRLDASATVATAGVVQGCVLGLGGPAPEGVARGAGAQLHVVSGPCAGTVFPLPNGDAVLGTGGDLELPDPAAARRHLQLHAGPAGIVATDLGAGTSLAGQRLAGPVAVGPADLLEVGDSLVRVVPPGGPLAAVTDGPDLTLSLNRPPRLRPALTVSSVELPAAPVPHVARKLAVLPLALPVLLGVVMALLLHNPLFLLFTLMSPLLALSTWWSDRRAGRSQGATAVETHVAALQAAESEITALAAAETRARRDDCPDAAALLVTAQGPGPRVWERRRGDDDSLLLRLGTGVLEATSVRVTGPANERRPSQPLLHDVPVALSLPDVGVVGIAGRTAPSRALGRWLVGQAVTLHSPRDLSVLLLVDPSRESSEEDWGWLRWLPHSAGHECLALVGNTVDSLAARVAELTALVDARKATAQDVRAQLNARRQSDVLVVLDGARGLRALPGMATVLQDGPAVGVHAVCLEETERLLPEECQAVLTFEGDARLTVRQNGEPTCAGVRADLVSAAWAEALARGLAPLRDTSADNGQGVVPDSARLLDVLDLQQPTGAAVRGRMGRTTAAVVGLDADGPFTLDLARHGPHALVAGTTGSGKSELLQTLVASLAVANRPDAMTFVLVDYKGGAAFRDCARLPHTVGMVTDLDGHLVERALASLTAELKTRESLLAAAGAKDLEDLWEAGGSLPRLVIVIDEFASLVEELPDFVRGLIGVAQRGRSLGVHLVLATQRPSGVVSPEIRANTNLRIALRVTDASESLDVLDAPDAASIGKSSPGRGYARTGHASLAAFQSARVGGRRPGAVNDNALPVEAFEVPWPRVGEPLPAPRRLDREPEDDQTDLHALVLAIQEACVDLDPPRRPWLDPLPPVVTLGELRREPPAGGDSLPPIPFGLEDLPSEQARRVAVLDLEKGGHLLVAGAARSGRSTLLRTLATSLAATVLPSDCHVYGIDCGNGALLPLAELPHVGAVVSRTQVERTDRLLTRLSEEVSRRQQALAERGFADLAEQRASSADPLPYLVLLVDRWEGFTGAFEDVDAGRLVDTFLRLLREGPGAGLRVVLTGDRSVLLGKVASSIEDTLCLRLADRSDYALAGLSPRTLPEEVLTGRAFRGDVGTEVQIALLVEDDSGPAQAAAVAELAEHWRGRRVGGRLPFRVEALPMRVTVAEVAHADVPTGALRTSMGIGGDELALQAVDLAVHGPGFTIAGPPRSGRSTALLAAAQGLLAGGTELVVLSPRPSPVRALDGTPGVLHVSASSQPGAAEVAAALNQARGPLAIVVDDAELLHGADVDDLLQQVLRNGRDQGHVVVLAGTTDELGSSFRGFTADARKSRSGLLLSPASHLEGELFGVRLPRSAAFSGPPGRGLLLRSGQPLLVQVPV